jgi:hypothetical protein
VGAVIGELILWGVLYLEPVARLLGHAPLILPGAVTAALALPARSPPTIYKHSRRVRSHQGLSENTRQVIAPVAARTARSSAAFPVHSFLFDSSDIARRVKSARESLTNYQVCEIDLRVWS